MLKQIPFKKEHLLIGGIAFLLLIGYRFAFKNTIEAWQNNKQLRIQLSQNTGISYQPGYLERKSKNIETILQLYKADTITFRNNVINIASLIAEKENVKLIEVPAQNVSYTTGRSIIQMLNFEGDYFSLTKVFHRLERTNGIGIIRSANWERHDLHSNSQESKKLVLEIYLEVAK